MSLSKILEEIKQVKPVAEEKIEGGNLDTLAGRRGRKRSAEERLSGLKTSYVEELRSTAVFILAVGSGNKEFEAVAKENFKCFTANPESFYRDLANRIPATIYQNKTAMGEVFDVVGRHLEDKAGELSILGYPQYIFNQKYSRHLNDQEDLVSFLKDTINEQVGAEVVGIQTIHDIFEEAINVGHEGKITPIVLSTNDEKLATELKDSLHRIGSRAFLVSVGKRPKNSKLPEGSLAIKDVTKESVEGVLTNIKNSIK